MKKFNHEVFRDRMIEVFGLKGLSDREIEKKLGRKRAYDWLTGKVIPRGIYLAGLCIKGQVSPDYLLGLSDEGMLMRISKYFSIEKSCVSLQIRLSKIAIANNLSGADVGRLTGLSTKAANNYLDGCTMPNARHIFSLCVALNCSAAYLLGFVSVQSLKNEVSYVSYR